MSIKVRLSSAILCSVAVLASTTAFSQEKISDLSRPDYDRKGIKAGGFMFKPKGDIKMKFNDNIYAAETDGEVNDVITTISPALLINSDWSSHELNMYASSDLNTYAEENEDDNVEFDLGINGRLDVLRDTVISAGVDYAQKNEDRGSPDSVSTSVDPTGYKELKANAGFYRGVGKVSVNFETEFLGLDYEDGKTAANVVIDNDDRDRNQLKYSARAAYDFMPDYKAFVEASYNTRDYDEDVALDRDSDGYEVALGASVNLTGKAKGEVYAGYMAQEYDASTLGDIAALALGGNLLWNPNQRTSVELGLKRGIKETIDATSSGYIQNVYSADLEYELEKNIILNGNIAHTENNYETTGAADREDDIFSAGVGAKYMVVRNVTFSLAYDYIDRDSNQSGQDYKSNVVTVGAGFGF